ncbi:MAG: AmmeMemoRadiSam system protein B [Candidatus Odinarchaeia archaeon]
MSVRMPAAIGFYPGSKDQLISIIESSFKHKFGPGSLPEKKNEPLTIMGGISPHAGYIYSGPIAAHLFYELAKQEKPETVMILGLSHGGYAGAALMSRGSWETPLGKVEIDTELADNIRESVGVDENGRHFIVDDDWPHINEHSLEVQLPFLQYIYGNDFKIVPIIFGSLTLSDVLQIGQRISNIIKMRKGKLVTIASTDLTHYGSLYYGFAPVGDTDINKILTWMKETDGAIIKAIEDLDPEAIYERAKKTTMCGFLPVTVITTIARTIGVTQVKTLKYATSYDIRGSKDAIVGYLSLLFRY